MIENKHQIKDHILWMSIADKMIHVLDIIKARHDGNINDHQVLLMIEREIELPNIVKTLLNFFVDSLMNNPDFQIDNVLTSARVHRKYLLDDYLELIDIKSLDFTTKKTTDMTNKIERKNFYLSKSLLGKNKVVKFNQNGKSYTYNHDEVFDKCRDELLTNPKRANSFPKHGTYTSYKVPAFVIDKASDLIKSA
jgi:hypothetical protein